MNLASSVCLDGKEAKANPRLTIPVFGNGDVNGPESALEKKNKYGVDGIMIGRASIGNPWVFRRIKEYINTGILIPEATIGERIEAAKEHLDFSVKWKGERVGIMEMRRHYANYFKGIANFKPTRLELVTSDNLEELQEIFHRIESKEDSYRFVD